MNRARPARSQRAAANRKQFWNDRVAAAATDRDKVNVWWSACLKVCAESRDPKVWAELVTLLHDFYMRHAK